jgi:hypothetical protein
MDAVAPVTHAVMNRAVQLGGFRLTETSHVPNTRLGVNRHAFPAVTFVLRGAFADLRTRATARVRRNVGSRQAGGCTALQPVGHAR